MLFKHFFATLISAKCLHYQTSLFSCHKSADKLFNTYLEQVDKFLEVFQGRHGKLNILSKKIRLDVDVVGDKNAAAFIAGELLFINTALPEYLDANEDRDLLNIRDDMQATLDQFLYFLTFQ